MEQIKLKKKKVPLEKTIVQNIVNRLKQEGVLWIIKTHGGAFQSSGLPDILFCAPESGRLVGLEVKRPSLGKLTDLQAAQINKISKAGGFAMVVHSVEEALLALEFGNRTINASCE